MLGYQADETTYKSSALGRRNKIALANDGLARKIAHQQSQVCPEPYDDLLQLARIGLMKAVERFEEDRDNRFSSYAVPWIRGEIQHYLRDKWGAIRVPRRSLELAARMRRIRQYMEKHGRTVADVKIANAIGLDEEKLLEVKGAVSSSTVSLDECGDIAFSARSNCRFQPLHPGGNLRDCLEALEGTSRFACEHDLTIDQNNTQSSNWVVGAVASLPSQERSCLLEAFFAGLSLEAIANRRNVDEFQVKLWIESALTQLNQEALNNG